MVVVPGSMAYVHWQYRIQTMSVLYYWCYPVPEGVLVPIRSLLVLKNSTQLCTPGVLVLEYSLGTSIASTHSKYQGVPDHHLCLEIIIMSNLRKITRTFWNPLVLEYIQGIPTCTWHMRGIQYEKY